jgi:hypothetical protein
MSSETSTIFDGRCTSVGATKEPALRFCIPTTRFGESVSFRASDVAFRTALDEG